MSLAVTLGYPKMVCSHVFRVYRHVMIRTQETCTQCSKEFEPYPSELKLLLYYYLASAIYFIAGPNAPLAIVLAVKWGYMGLYDNMRAREGFVRSYRVWYGMYTLSATHLAKEPPPTRPHRDSRKSPENCGDEDSAL